MAVTGYDLVERGSEGTVFVKAECNLENLGFFTPSSKRLKQKNKKVIRFRKKTDRGTQELKISILAVGDYGLPNTKHLDFYRAFQRILTDRIRKEGHVPKKIEFTTADLLTSLGVDRPKQSGKYYRQVVEWLKVMQATVIEAEGCLWDAKEREWFSDTVHVFERVVAFRKDYQGGESTDRHLVWLSDWQQRNINEHYLLSINHDTYKSLKCNISKTLFSMLNSWFFVGNGKYTKNYDELCQWLGVGACRYMSDIRKQLGPSHRELQKKGFLKEWKYESRRGAPPIITWYAGEQYFSDRQRLEEMKGGSQVMTLREVKGSPGSKRAGELVTYFHGKMGRNCKPKAAEMKKAQVLLGEHGEEVARFVVDFAVQEAGKTNFSMRNFGAVVKVYLEDALKKWLAFEERESVAEEADTVETVDDERQKRRKREATELVEFLHQRLGNESRRASRVEIEEAMALILRNGKARARALVESTIEDAKEMRLATRDFGLVREVMEGIS